VYLENPSALQPLKGVLPLLCYLITTKTAMGSMLAQESEAKDNVIFYLTKKLFN